MPAPTDPNLKAAIEQAYINSNLSSKELSEKFDGAVSDRTIERWAKDGGWEAKRTASKIINLDTTRQPQPRQNPRPTRDLSDDPFEIANTVIADLQGDMARSDMPAKDKAAIANSLKSWVEFRRKLKPPTVADLVELAIELGVSADEFLDELENAWTKRA